MKWIVVTMAAFPFGGYAQWERLGTDRPDRTEATMTVPMGSLQLETGAVLFPHPEGNADLGVPQMLLR